MTSRSLMLCLAGLAALLAASPGCSPSHDEVMFERLVSSDFGGGVKFGLSPGQITPTLGVPIAMAYVAPGDAEPGTVVDVEIRDARIPARVVALPFYRREA